jgi:multisubunit Na+/H+ antiporter MnhE subunit
VIRVVTSVAGLTAVYALALASLDPWDVAIGAGLSLLVIAAFGRFIFRGEPVPAGDLLRRAVHLPAFLLATAADIVRGTIAVARVVLARDPAREMGFVAAPIGERSESGLAVSTLVNTLSPGSVLIAVDRATGTWTIHALDATDPAAIRAEIEAFYERYQRPVWP